MFYYGIVGIVFMFSLMVLQKGYLTYYIRKSKKDAKELIQSGGKPSDLLLAQKGIKEADEIREVAGITPEDVEHITQMSQQGQQVVSEKDLKRIEKQMKKKVKF